MHECSLCLIAGRSRSYSTKNDLNRHVEQFHGFETVGEPS